jgi:putative transposase
VGVCRAHAMRNRTAVARHDQRQVIGALIRTIFAQPDRDRAVTQLRQVVDQLEPIAPTVAERLQAMEDDLLAYASFPLGHWSKIWSTTR